MGKDWRPKSSSNISTPAVREHGSSPKPNAKATTGGYSSLAVRAFRTVKILFLMKLLTKEIISKFEKHPFHSQDGKGMDAEVLVKYFNPCGTGTWLITEAEREGDDWRLFGYCHIYEWEWGYLMLSELASLRLPFGLTIERDIYTARKYVRDFLPQDE